MKSLIKSALRSFGLEVHRTHTEPGSVNRPIANVGFFLEDIQSRGFKPGGMIDVGANRGDWTRLALSIFPQTPVIMIEPQDEMEAGLSSLCKENKGSRYVKAGAGRVEGTLVQTICDDLVSSSFVQTVDERKLKSGKQRKTKIVTIDGLLKDAPKDFSPDLVKLDVQGFELEALSGGARLFGQTEVFIIETALFGSGQWPLTREVISFMSDRAYEIYDITDYLRRPNDGALAHVDFSFVKRDGLFRQSNDWDRTEKN